MENMEKQIKKLVNDLSHSETYNRKHAAWTLARLAQKGHSKTIVNAGAIPELVKCLEDEMIVKYRAVWALSMLAKHEQKQAVLDADIIPIFQNLVDDNTKVEICHAHTSEMVFTTLGDLAREAINNLEGS